jgi:hypothetical protein
VPDAGKLAVVIPDRLSERSLCFLDGNEAGGVIGIGVGGVNIGREENEPAQEGVAFGGTGFGHQIGGSCEIGQRQRDGDTFGHDRPIGHHERWDLRESIDGLQALPGLCIRKQFTGQNEFVVQSIKGKLRFCEDRTPAAISVERENFFTLSRAPQHSIRH